MKLMFIARLKCLVGWILVSCMGLACANEGQPDAVVAASGGDFTTVQEAINKAPQNTSGEKPWVILVKPGTYKERLHIQREKRFVRLIGEDPEKTVITYNLFADMKGPDGLPIGTFRTPTVLIDADDFTLEKITLENSAGPVGQALALRVDGDRVTFRDCTFLGFQDTILLNRGRQFFSNCTITGAVDFIFGGATAYFKQCAIHCVRDGYITAASTPEEVPYGFVFDHCKITMKSPGMKVYLGRPWRPHASTIFLNTTMDEGIRPEGWHNWKDVTREKTARYSEFNSRGAGASPAERVPWARELSEADAAKITPSVVLSGWQP